MATFCGMAYTWDTNKNKTSETITGVMSGHGFTSGGTTYDFEDRLRGYASYIDEPVVRKTAGTGGTLVYFHRNQQCSVTAITTSAGAVTERYAYSAYGQPTILDASASVLSASAISNRYTYTGREWDATLGLYHFRARWMSPIAGRFLGRDPLGYEDANNLSSTLLFLSKVDPNGTLTMSDDSNPDPSEIKGTEKKFLDGCECALLKDRKVKPKEGDSWVACDGNGDFKIRRQKDVDIKDFECLKNCGVLDCIGDHEKHHIKQFKLRCPDACQRGCGDFPGPDDGAMGFQEDCLKYAECYAGRVTLNCINRKQFDKVIGNSNCGGKTCKE
jgi:RHS repeat-associated protein